MIMMIVLMMIGMLISTAEPIHQALIPPRITSAFLIKLMAGEIIEWLTLSITFFPCDLFIISFRVLSPSSTIRQSSGFRNTGGSLLFASQANSTGHSFKNKVNF